MMSSNDNLRRTPLFALHQNLGAKLVPFAGYEMPVQYKAGILAEHLHTRSKAGLFDVSHMGQAMLVGPSHEATAKAIEALVPADIKGLAPGQVRYSQLLNDEGGIRDDLMIARPGHGGGAASRTEGRSAPASAAGYLGLIVNAACKEADFALIEAALPKTVRLEIIDHALLALQGPLAARVLEKIIPGVADMVFMQSRAFAIEGIVYAVSRSGYTGEDGFEISLSNGSAIKFAERLLADNNVLPIGLGARDSLRLEAGLCLYGHDIDETTSPIEASLSWSIQKRRREAGDFPGASRILRELKDGPARRRVGVSPEGRQPAREGTPILAAGRKVGTLTSGGFGPSVNAPVAMGYIEAAFAKPGTQVTLEVRGKELPARIADRPFTPHRYKR
jgi:aminomethyltransferase